MRRTFEPLARTSLRVLAVVMLVASLGACSSGGDSLEDGGDIDGPSIDDGTGGVGEAPTATMAPDGGALGNTEAIVVTFSERMDAASLSLGGDMAATAQAEWSDDDNVLTLTPANAWGAGTRTLELDAADTDGDALDTLTATFDVDLVIEDFAAADIVIGQPDFSSGAPNQGASADANTLASPAGGVSFDPATDSLFVSDTGAARVLGFQGIPTQNNANADMAIGQPDFTTIAPDTTATGMRTPYATTTASGQLVVTDTDSHRVLIFNDIPASGPAAASVVVGQASMTARETGCTATNLNAPRGHVVTADGKLIVADTGNNRVLVWNRLPTGNGVPADLVLGQGDFMHCTANDDDQDATPSPDWPPHAYTMREPTAVWSDGEKLLVADSGNHRVLIWNAFPTENFAAADQLLGQNSFRTMIPNDSDQDGVTDAPSASVFDYPNGVWSDGNQIFVSDRNNNRLLAWDDYPVHFFEPADHVIGQGDFNNNAPNDADQDGAADPAPSANTLNLPGGVAVIDGRLAITDTGNSRILIYDTD